MGNLELNRFQFILNLLQDGNPELNRFPFILNLLQDGKLELILNPAASKTNEHPGRNQYPL